MAQNIVLSFSLLFAATCALIAAVYVALGKGRERERERLKLLKEE